MYTFIAIILLTLSPVELIHRVYSYFFFTPTNWYIRLDGGSRYDAAFATSGQCNGKFDAPYSGSGVNQNCAFGDFRYLYDTATYGGFGPWVIAGGDIVTVRNSKTATTPHAWRIGFNQGTSGADTWCQNGTGPYACYSQAIPAGTIGAHTKILGENYASCNQSNMTELFGGFAVGLDINATTTSYIDISCFEITRHSQCIRHGFPAYPTQCNSSLPLDDYDGDGIVTNALTHDVTFTDLWIHGHTDRGIIGPIGANVTCLRCIIAYNGMAGWDFDDGSSSPYGASASWNFLYSTIEWNGCNQEYPITHTYPAISCYGQSSGGYGDGVGTPAGTGTGLNVVIDHSTFRYNTQDGEDLGHVDAGTQTLQISNSIAYGNGGQQMKWGYNFFTFAFYNNILLGNCDRMSVALAGTPSTYNTNLGDFCRAQSMLSWNYRATGSGVIANNTFVTYAPTSFVIGCVDSTTCNAATTTFKNNHVLGYDNPATYSQGGAAGGPAGFYCQDHNSIGVSCASGFITWSRTNNNYFSVRNISCPTGYSNETCASPALVAQPTGNASSFLETQLDISPLGSLSLYLTGSSPLINAGTICSGCPSTDYTGITYSNPPPQGALNYTSAPPAVHRVFHGIKH